MSGVPSTSPEVAGILTTLRRAHTRVGDGQVPDDQTFPYAVLYVLRPSFDGPLGDRWADQDLTVQITSVGGTREQAQALQDRLRAAALTDPIAIDARVVINRQLVLAEPIRRDDALGSPLLFYAVDQIRISTTPS